MPRSTATTSTSEEASRPRPGACPDGKAGGGRGRLGGHDFFCCAYLCAMRENTRVAVLGASGYAGGELVRLLAGHRRADVTFLGAKDSAGRTLAGVHPHLASAPGAADRLAPVEVEAAVRAADVAFCALPNGTSSELVPLLLGAGVRVIDLAGDFRLPARRTRSGTGSSIRRQPYSRRPSTGARAVRRSGRRCGARREPGLLRRRRS